MTERGRGMRKNIYERPRVEKLLDRTADCPLFVVAAGAGYGKTTAVQAWLKKSGLAWGDSGSDLRRRKPLLGKTLRRPGTLLNRSRRRCHPALCGKNRSPAAAPRSRSAGRSLHRANRRRLLEIPRRHLPPNPSEGAPLSEGEREVLRRTALGRTRKTVAEKLGIKEDTVKKHLQNAYRKLGASNKIEALRAASALLAAETIRRP